MKDFWMIQDEKNYISDIIKSWIKNRNELVKRAGTEPLKVQDQFLAYKILIDESLIEALREVNRGGKKDYFLNHIGFNSKVEVKSCEKNGLNH